MFRDFGDSAALAPVFDALGLHDKLAAIWHPKGIIKDLHMGVGIFHGTKMPNWLHYNDFKKMGADFFKEFNQEYSRDTGIPIAELHADVINIQEAFGAVYSSKGKSREACFERLKEEHLSHSFATAACAGKFKGL